jgi:hypothetical protein
MFEITENGPLRIDIDVSGKIDSDEMKMALEKLIEKSSVIRNGNMLYTITDIALPSFGALGVELSKLPSLFKLLKSYDRVAVVADKTWIRKMSEWEGALLPGLEIKGFEPDERAAAEAWLSIK